VTLHPWPKSSLSALVRGYTIRAPLTKELFDSFLANATGCSGDENMISFDAEEAHCGLN
jgi:hypothetical protein